jgi:hypothetical protein
MTFKSTQTNKIFSQLCFWKVMLLQFLKRFYGNLYPLKSWRRWSHLNQTQKGPLMWHKGFVGYVHFKTSFDNDDDAIILRSTPTISCDGGQCDPAAKPKLAYKTNIACQVRLGVRSTCHGTTWVTCERVLKSFGLPI